MIAVTFPVSAAKIVLSECYFNVFKTYHWVDVIICGILSGFSKIILFKIRL